MNGVIKEYWEIIVFSWSDLSGASWAFESETSEKSSSKLLIEIPSWKATLDLFSLFLLRLSSPYIDEQGWLRGFTFSEDSSTGKLLCLFEREEIGGIIDLIWWPDPPGNCHLTVKKLPKTWLFFLIAKNCHLKKKLSWYSNGKFPDGQVLVTPNMPHGRISYFRIFKNKTNDSTDNIVIYSL